MALKKDASGRILVECINPDCKLLHLVRRNRDYEGKQPIRFRCTNCKTSWHATEAEREIIVKAYSEPPKRKTKKADPPQEQPKSNEEEPKQSWLDRILS